ncbi:unnamed protein product [Gordionus sp. m RMFG-2023]
MSFSNSNSQETLSRYLEVEKNSLIISSQQEENDSCYYNVEENRQEIISNEEIYIREFDPDSDIEPITSQDASTSDLSQISDISTSNITGGIRIPLDVVTRWNSKFLMISSINKNLDASSASENDILDNEALPFSVSMHNILRKGALQNDPLTDEISLYLREDVAKTSDLINLNKAHLKLGFTIYVNLTLDVLSKNFNMYFNRK